MPQSPLPPASRRQALFDAGHRLSRRHSWLALAAGAALSLAVALATLADHPLLRRADLALLDRVAVAPEPAGQVADAWVVDIDEASLAQVGQWPWPRYRLADLLNRIAAERPRAIALDVLLPEADRSSLDTLKEAFRRDFGVALDFPGVPEALRDNDRWLGAVMDGQAIVGARYFRFDATDSAKAAYAPALRPGLGIDGAVDALDLPQASGAVSNAPAIATQTRRTGFINVAPDDDGVLRRMPLLIRHEGIVHPSLALATTLRALQLDSATVESGPHGLGLRLGDRTVPIDARGTTALRFHGASDTYPAVSALALLSGELRPGTLTGRIVYVGTSAAGLHDRHVTHVDPAFPGLKVHAAMTQNLLDGVHVREPVWADTVVAALATAAGLGLTALFALGARVALWGGVAAGVGLLAGAASSAGLAATGIFVSPVPVWLAVSAVFAVGFVVRFARERARAQRWRVELEQARQITIESMASVAETRDPETGAHIKRTQHYVRAVARQLRRTSERHALTLTDEYIELLFLSAPLHDIGKVGVPDHILLKPGRLTPEEMDVMKRHAEFGRRIIRSASQHIHGENFLVVAGEIAATHHECWDGSGYPLGLAGQDIPLAGRIMAVADVYDALISRRCYKEPFTHAHSIALMHKMGTGKFDPEVFAAFLAIEPEILGIAARFQDEPASPEEAAAGGVQSAGIAHSTGRAPSGSTSTAGSMPTR